MVIDDLAGIVGKENIRDDPAALEEYSGGQAENMPVAVARPANTDEVQRIVKWANESGTPLTPVSSGPPHFRGGSTPGVAGTVIVDLRRMDKIIRIDAGNRVAIVEPGVTFSQLQAELAAHGMSAYTPLLPRSSKSVLAAALERDPILMPSVHFDSTDPMLCTEIVFGAGEKMRTGEAAGPDALEQQWELGKATISPFGPTQMDPQRLVSGAQGTIGILTWMSLKCREMSSLYRAFMIPSDSLDPLIELSYHLTRIRFTGKLFIVNGLNLAAMTQEDPQQIAAVRDGLPSWVMFAGFEGCGLLPEEKVQYLKDDLKDLAASYGLQPQTELSGIKAGELYPLLMRPSPDPHWKLRCRGGFRDVFFLATQGKTPELSGVVADLAGQLGFPRENIGAYIQPVVQGTSCHYESNFYYDPADGAQADLVRRLEAAALDRLEAAGAFFSRPYPGWVDVAYRRCPDTVAMQKKVKDIFDPNWILNPGKLCFGAGEKRGN
ncbi:MAG: FAD-binding oxidoreductase [Thermoleophilia bacterium]|nr:FAD-binding oxidoreductase [Thermoleophilia bacterium]